MNDPMGFIILLGLISVTFALAMAVRENVLLLMEKVFDKPRLLFYFKSEDVEKMYYDFQERYLNFPHYGSDEAAGFDIKASENVTLDPGQFMMIRTGVHFDIPEGYELQVRSRSGLAAKDGIQVLNSPGTVDSDYTGEVKVILKNGGAGRRTITKGERIAQLVFARVADRPETKQVYDKDSLGKTNRGEGGFGSTGK